MTIDANGQTGICIGSGLGGAIEICQGKYVLEITGDTGVGIGAFDADSRIDISRSTVKLNIGGGEIAAIGTIGGNHAEVLIKDAIVITNIGARRGTCVGALDERTDFMVENANFRTTARGENSLSVVKRQSFKWLNNSSVI